MNTLQLGRCLGDVTTSVFQRQHQYHLIQSLEHFDNVTFNIIRPMSGPDPGSEETVKPRAHTAGTNCIAIDPQQGRFLASGGADSTIRLWDLESCFTSPLVQSSSITCYPAAALTRASPLSHTHALTSISIYPFDPVPSTILSTSHDKTLLLSQTTPSNLTPLHKFELDFTPYTHTISPIPSSTPLVAVGTTHPAIRLLDLRSGLATHSLPGHNAAIYALTFSAKHPHILIAGSADSRILLFDIRRANPAFASLDLDDSIGFPSGSTDPTESRPLNLHLNFSAQAHTGPVTGLAIPPSDPNKLISTGHDQRIRVWDLPSGRNDLVHFGPRVRNSRQGNLTPLTSPAGVGKPGRELLFWPNDDGRGEIHVHSMREGNLVRVMKTKGVDRSNVNKKGSSVGKLTSGGRINAVVCRVNAEAGGGLEMYSAHGDGRICVWHPPEAEGEDQEIRETGADDYGGGSQTTVLDEEQSKKKRKRDLIGDLVEGLTRRPVTFS